MQCLTPVILRFAQRETTNRIDAIFRPPINLQFLAVLRAQNEGAERSPKAQKRL